VTDISSAKKGKRESYNVISKNLAQIIGASIVPIVLLMLPLLLIGFIWTEFGDIVFSTHMISDGAIMTVLLITGHILALKLGKDGGKLDDDYIKAKNTYEQLTEDIYKVGTLYLGAFCLWQVDLEYEEAIRVRLFGLKIPPKEWNTLKDMSCEDLVEKYGKKRGKKLYDLQKLPQIELNEAILLYEGGTSWRGSITPSAEESLRSKGQWINLALTTLLTSIITISCVFTFTSDISFAKVIYTIFKLVLLLAQMARGYEKGAHAYNTTQVMHFKSKSMYLREYLRFMNDNIYERLPEKYKIELAEDTRKIEKETVSENVDNSDM